MSRRNKRKIGGWIAAAFIMLPLFFLAALIGDGKPRRKNY